MLILPVGASNYHQYRQTGGVVSFNPDGKNHPAAQSIKFEELFYENPTEFSN